MHRITVLTVVCCLAAGRDGAAQPAKKAIVTKARTQQVRVIEPTAEELPTPPSDEPKVYAAWTRELPRVTQLRIARFCRKHPLDYEPSCGGIGPLHIPTPPSLMKMKRSDDNAPETEQPTREDWYRALTVAQRRYVDSRCHSEINAFSQLCGGTPLVVAFDSQPVQFTTGGGAGTDWPTAVTPWIALDRNHDGMITSGAELFGSDTVLPDGTTARNGFAALAPLDANHDGRLDRADPAFASLLLWADRDRDRQGTPDELTPLASVVVSISLDDHAEPRCDERLNCERERAAIQWRDGRGSHDGSVVDVYLHYR